MTIFSVCVWCKEMVRLTAILARHVMNFCPLVCEYPLPSFFLSIYYPFVAQATFFFIYLFFLYNVVTRQEEHPRQLVARDLENLFKSFLPASSVAPSSDLLLDR